MDLKDTLLRIEHELAHGGGAEYRRHLVDEALVIVPGQLLDKDATVQAIEASPGWDEVTIEDSQLVALSGTSAALSYRFSGRRGADFSYEALMSSVYVRRDDGWKLALHQQTPLG
jgi:hypothetical protein